MSQTEWIVPFQGRNSSYGIGVNFLYQDGNVYVSDNHLTAAWCWAQHPLVREKHSILHIDAHYDTRGAEAGVNLTLDSLSEMDFETYQSLRHPNDTEIPLFTWDNYLSIYEALNRENIERAVFSTHRIGTEPDFVHETVQPEKLIETIRSEVRGGSWLLNLDLDFFYSNGEPRFSEESRPDVFESLATAVENVERCVITVALSPECTGSWPLAEQLLEECAQYLDICVELPGATDNANEGA